MNIEWTDIDPDNIPLGEEVLAIGDNDEMLVGFIRDSEEDSCYVCEDDNTLLTGVTKYILKTKLIPYEYNL